MPAGPLSRVPLPGTLVLWGLNPQGRRGCGRTPPRLSLGTMAKVIVMVCALFHPSNPPFSFQRILKKIQTSYYFTHKELLTEKEKDFPPKITTIPFSCPTKLPRIPYVI